MEYRSRKGTDVERIMTREQDQMKGPLVWPVLQNQTQPSYRLMRSIAALTL
jgi:hypothetical protein